MHRTKIFEPPLQEIATPSKGTTHTIQLNYLVLERSAQKLLRMRSVCFSVQSRAHILDNLCSSITSCLTILLLETSIHRAVIMYRALFCQFHSCFIC